MRIPGTERARQTVAQSYCQRLSAFVQRIGERCQTIPLGKHLR